MKRTILFSGGMDSTVLAYHVASESDNHDEIKLLSFNYGAKHNKKENAQARIIASTLEREFSEIAFTCQTIALDFNKIGIVSGLLEASGTVIPEGHYEHESMKATVVPFRNGIMLSVAAGIACEGKLYYGCHAGDHAIYPDCRAPFVEAMRRTILEGTDNQLELITPFVRMTKRDIAILGSGIDVPFEKTWSCYNGREAHCGKCGTCIERKEALDGFDNTLYEKEEA